MVKFSRFDVCLINFDPTLGSEMKKVRPCLIISPDAMNHSRLKTVIIAPMTSVLHDQFPTRIRTVFNKKEGEVALDQIRAIDRVRIIKNLGSVHASVRKKVLGVLQQMFS